MTIANTTGAAKTLFVPVENLDDVLQRESWYAVDISLVLCAMTKGKGVTDFARAQQCIPPFPTEETVNNYLNEWYVCVCNVCNC